MPVPSVMLGSSGVFVSMCCLGTMTWGDQNTELDAHAQLDYYVFESGIKNPFIDTAELYPVPPKRETVGRTEVYIGNWLEKHPEVRPKIFLASKVSGRSPRGWIFANRQDPPGEDGETRLSRDQILTACDASLKRLKTDYLDLYQLHWPERGTPTFGALEYKRSMDNDDDVSFDESVGAIGELIKAGKVKHWGISNENAVGVMRFLESAKRLGVPPPVSIQNDFALVDRRFEQDGTAEACSPKSSGVENGVSLLAYGALAGGTLSGKYHEKKDTDKARHTLYPEFQSRYHSQGTMDATKDYVEAAKKHGLSGVDLAYGWAATREYMGSVIIGATTMEQLKANIAAFEKTIPKELLEEVDAINLKYERPYFRGSERLGRNMPPPKKKEL
uniref:NADP-dependent oxidoreductase domain-containing protein n=1 Tax=Hemiselmis andersenii TaxID=464988 RepID=A0A7S1DKA7_HEMAN|mmetsp:Transcript_15547/g.37694  ORF Transcript_15547/g.37694 Transcript_15547/m.37694 type:complete len:388 (+) Transcript_15547:63-1226(+)|eukprot:CAMPEP_0114144924 /NCGR_PEP_ID=MMETSP0043_2-20121206/19784_1 /TAXON_ID=464988 /ORGANISM="Hemiselmis andersenii, Strain CCMP644" /LENGTH=387 /DNA_ID=CAMNT_0001239331 /DNA_START=43 /DNA_END=1206 /DNA_ORIENTATION=-